MESLPQIKLSSAEISALRNLKNRHGCILISHVPDVSEKDEFGDVIPGMRVYERLQTKGLILITEEEPEEDGFVFTPQIELLDTGDKMLLLCDSL